MTFKESVSFLVQSLVRALGSAVNKGKCVQRGSVECFRAELSRSETYLKDTGTLHIDISGVMS